MKITTEGVANFFGAIGVVMIASAGVFIMTALIVSAPLLIKLVIGGILFIAVAAVLDEFN